jgi:hypothetical protein
MIKTQSQNEEIRQFKYKVGHEVRRKVGDKVWYKFGYEVGRKVQNRVKVKVLWKVRRKLFE